MSLITATSEAALPTILDQPFALAAGRRQRIENFNLGSRDLDGFNRLLVRLGRTSAPLNPDQLATASRELCVRSTTDGLPPCIRISMDRADPLLRMVADPGWKPDDETIEAAVLVTTYLRNPDDLIPDQLGRVGRLDDAIVIQTAWPRLAAEVERYLDYCRLRTVEAELRQCDSDQFEFTRDDWQQARLVEAALAHHQRRVGLGSYLPGRPQLFAVH